MNEEESSSFDAELFVVPPADPEEWTDEQWIKWLKATDEAIDESLSPRMTRIVHSSGGQVLGQAMLGLSNAIYGRKDDEVVIVRQRNSDPEDDEMEIHLDFDHPEQSTVLLRPDTKAAD